jgi:hypothetical protein
MFNATTGTKSTINEVVEVTLTSLLQQLRLNK